MLHAIRQSFWVVAFCAIAWAQNPAPAAPQGSDPPAEVEAETPEAESSPTPTTGSQRTQLNLLGEVNAEGGESRRNENVSITLIDNNVLKELNTRVGTSANIMDEFRPDRTYFGLEFGGDARGPIHPNVAPAKAFHGDLNWLHNNSIFSARSFFQVGSVQPARTNDYGFNVGGPLWKGASLTVNGNQRKIRGQVNGNVLVPKQDERTPLVMDPEARAFVALILAQYPNQLPNRTDINERALNTNAPQSVDNDHASGLFDQVLGDRDRLAFRYDITLQHVEAFQLVNGQNPDTITRNHRARIGWNRKWSASTTFDLSIGFDHTKSRITPDQLALPLQVQMQGALTNVGGDGTLPTNRTQNDFTYAARLRQVRNRHTWDAGADLIRRQINGIESLNNRGNLQFANDFGRDTITNLRLGTPSNYNRALGVSYRAFRQWDATFWAGDSGRATNNLTLNIGLRFGMVTAPTDAAGIGGVPYDGDFNNAAPRFGFAYRLPGRSGVLRGGYGVQFGEIFTATYGHVRFNPPGIIAVQVNSPSLVNPLGNIRFENLDPNSRHVAYILDKELATPYSHQYNMSWQGHVHRDWKVEIGYVGSRSHKLFVNWFRNRALPVAGIPLTTATVNDRRADHRFFDIQNVINGSRGFYDAGKAVVTAPRWHGLNLDFQYWFSKAIDLGGDYTTRATGRDSGNSRAQSEFNYRGDMKGLSDFDQPHAFLVRSAFDTPRAPRGFAEKLLGTWQFTGVMLRKSGTAFQLDTGSDGPGIGNVDGTRSDRPNLLDPSVLGRTINHPDTSQKMLPRSAFAFIHPGELRGNLGRNTFRKDQVWNINLGASRRWILGREKSLQFKAETLNLANTPQFSEPGNQLSNPNFGQIINTMNDGRTFNFSLRLSF